MTMQDNLSQQVEDYRSLVLQYEKLDEQIDTLLDAHKHRREDQLDEDTRQQYRELARQRADTLNAMRVLEQQLQLDESDA